MSLNSKFLLGYTCKRGLLILCDKRLPYCKSGLFRRGVRRGKEPLIFALLISRRIPNEAYAADYVAVGKVLKVCIEFSLVEPQGGLHFVVPENPFKHQENKQGSEVKQEEEKDKDAVKDEPEASSSSSR